MIRFPTICCILAALAAPSHAQAAATSSSTDSGEPWRAAWRTSLVALWVQ